MPTQADSASELLKYPVLTLSEAATLLRLPQNKVSALVDSGTLPGARVETDYRIPTAGLIKWLNGGDGNGSSVPSPTMAQAPIMAPTPMFLFRKDKPFKYTFPKCHPETYSETYISHFNDEGIKTMKIGFSERSSGGMKRKRAVVFLDGYPTVEFTGANDFTTSELMASVLKGRDRSQIRPDEGVPPEYRHLHVEPYNAYVVGPYCSSNLAVICKKADLAVMAEHALIRHRFRS
jgi:excisionase family DNA binding protein